MNVSQYEFGLTTGERIYITELDPERMPELLDKNVTRSIEKLLRMCSSLKRQDVEDAKRGYDTPFKQSLRTPPDGCLIKLESPICSRSGDCSMYKSKECTTHFLEKRLGKFPLCFEYTCDFQSRELAGVIIMSWKEGRYVLLITP